jgi:hypothetical protein
MYVPNNEATCIKGPGKRMLVTSEELGRRIFVTSVSRLKIKTVVNRKKIARTMKNDANVTDSGRTLILYIAWWGSLVKC